MEETIPVFYDEDTDGDLGIKICSFIEKHGLQYHDDNRESNFGESILYSLETIINNHEIIFTIISQKSSNLLSFTTETALLSAIKDPEKRKKIIPIFNEMPEGRIPTILKSIKALHFTSGDKVKEDNFWKNLHKLLEHLKSRNGTLNRSVSTHSEDMESLRSVDSGMGSVEQSDSDNSSDYTGLQDDRVSSTTSRAHCTYRRWKGDTRGGIRTVVFENV